MSESVLPPVGQILRDAREAQGISLDDAAVRLRLMHRQIEAMEADDFDSLGQPVFARGFVRNYARLLGLAPEPLLARMEGAPAEPALVSQAELPPARSWLTSPWVMLLLLSALALVALPVALYWWLNSDVEEVPNPGASSVVQSAPGIPSRSVPQPAITLPASAAESVPVVPESPVNEGMGAGAPSSPEPVAANSVLHLEFGDEAWVEIKDATGRVLHRQLNPPGTSLDVRGQPPFDLVVGNAAQVRMTYNGRPIDLKPFIDVTVARFTLEE